MNKILLIAYTSICLLSCGLDQELDMQDMGHSPGYFVECYCVPGEMFNLTATRIAPINEDQYLDYSIEFNVHITTDERFKLYHSLFHEPGTKFIYNYASNRKLTHDASDSVLLEITAPDSTRITASTAIPENVAIDTAGFSGNNFYINFTSSPDPAQNYYILRADFMRKGEIIYQNLSFHEGLTGKETVTHAFSLENITPVDSVVTELKRMTRDGYRYQLSLKDAIDANKDNITSPTPLAGNITGALGIFTCYTYARKTVKCDP